MSNIQETIKKDIEENPIILFMKGSKHMPLCGFSGKVVEILNHYQVDFVTRDVLQDEALRFGIKEYSNWPTLPQLYIYGEFIGGCDIVTQLHKEGKLEQLLKRSL